MKQLTLFLIALSIIPIFAAAQACPHGELNEAYCDRDGDMLADTPSNSSNWSDPYELIFAYTPVEDPLVYKEAWSDFIVYLSEVTGKRVRFFPFQSNDAQIEAMRIGKLHVAGFNTGSVPKAVNCAGFHPIAMMGKADGGHGYEMELITYPGSGIDHVEDIRGETITFTAPSSNSGYKAPVALLKKKFGLIKDRDYHYTFSGKHSNSLLGVAQKRYKIATVANSVRKRIEERGLIHKGEIKILRTSHTFPTTGYGYAHDLKPSLAHKIQKAFETFQWTNKKGEASSLQKEFSHSGYSSFIPLDYKKHFEIIRMINKENGIPPQCQ